MKTIIRKKRVTPRKKRIFSMEKGPFIGIGIVIEKENYTKTRDLEITILLPFVCIRYQLIKFKELKNKYAKA